MTDTSVYNGNVVKRFTELKANAHLAHAYLFVGPQGVGKSETALVLAQLLNCERPHKDSSCGECPACRKIAGKIHPDVHWVEKEEDKETIGIDQIRDLIRQSQLRPYEGRRKIFIIKNAEDLTAESGNSLLKTLEEPVATSFLILTTSVVEKLLDTVRSRCHVMVFPALSSRKLAQIMKKDYAMEDSQAYCLASMAQGCPSIARRLFDGGFLKRKNTAIDELFFAGDNEAYWKKVLSDRQEIRSALDVLLSLLRDLMLLKVGGPEDILVNADRLPELKRWKSQYLFNDLLELNREVVEALCTLEENLNVKVAFALIRERLLAANLSR